MTTPNIADLLTKVKERQARLGDGRDARSDNERAEWFATYRTHADTISGLMNAPDDLKYTATHQWVRLEADGTATVGITDHAQEQLGDVVFVQHPDVGRTVKRGENCAVVESVKAASDIPAPLSGEIVEVNAAAAVAAARASGWAGEAWLIHFNHTNALLDGGEAAAAWVEARGVGLGREGQAWAL